MEYFNGTHHVRVELDDTHPDGFRCTAIPAFVSPYTMNIVHTQDDWEDFEPDLVEFAEILREALTALEGKE